MKITANKIKEIDNKLTYAIGYRNLYNIVVLAVGTVMVILNWIGGTLPAEYATLGFIVFILGGKWFLDQLFNNVDVISVSEIDEMK